MKDGSEGAYRMMVVTFKKLTRAHSLRAVPHGGEGLYLTPAF